MSMLFMPQPFPITALDSWIKGDAESLKYGDSLSMYTEQS